MNLIELTSSTQPLLPCSDSSLYDKTQGEDRRVQARQTTRQGSPATWWFCQAVHAVKTYGEESEIRR